MEGGKNWRPLVVVALGRGARIIISMSGFLRARRRRRRRRKFTFAIWKMGPGLLPPYVAKNGACEENYRGRPKKDFKVWQRLWREQREWGENKLRKLAKICALFGPRRHFHISGLHHPALRRVLLRPAKTKKSPRRPYI